jgi:FkbM family methyltransferase
MGGDWSPFFRRLEKIILLMRFGLNFPPRYGAWPKYEYLKPWFVELKPQTVIDIGVNMGQFFHLAYRLFPQAQMWGIEPFRPLFDKIQRIYSGISRVQLECCACGKIDGETDFYISTDSQNSSTHTPTLSFFEERPENEIIGKEKVPLYRLDSLVESCSGPILLKIDVQGAELDVLEGADEVWDRIAYIIIEAPFEEAYEGAAHFDDIYRFLTGRGFVYQGALGQLNSERTGHVRQEDSIYIKETYHSVKK